jgi:hypothetical protein
MMADPVEASAGTTACHDLNRASDGDAEMRVTRHHVWTPTSEEIARETARIRATWSERERQRRAVHCPPWAVPKVFATTAECDVE